MGRPTVAHTDKDLTIRFAELDFDGQKIKLAYDFNSMCEVEAEAGVNLLHGIGLLLGSTCTIRQLRGLLCAAMRIAKPSATLEDAGRLCRIDMIPAIESALLDAYEKSIPEAKKVKNPPLAEEKS